MSVFLKSEPMPKKEMSKEDLNLIIDEHFINERERQNCYKELSRILFSQELVEVKDFRTDYDQTKIEETCENNYIFSRFHHLFEYEATYYSYLLAKLVSNRLFYSPRGTGANRFGMFSRGAKPIPKEEIDLIFAKGGENATEMN